MPRPEGFCYIEYPVSGWQWLAGGSIICRSAAISLTGGFQATPTSSCWMLSGKALRAAPELVSALPGHRVDGGAAGDGIPGIAQPLGDGADDAADERRCTGLHFLILRHDTLPS